MSFIDCYRHQFAGLLAGLPVYLPEEKVSGEFDASETSVLLGGGSGEHDAAIFQAAPAVGAVIAAYLDELECEQCGGGGAPCDFCDGSGLMIYEVLPGGEYNSKYHPATSILLQRLVMAGLPAEDLASRLYDLTTTLLGELDHFTQAGNFSDWRGDAWAGVVKRAQVSVLAQGYDREKHHNIEYWLTCCVGEYVFVNAPERALAEVELSELELKMFHALRELVASRGMFAAIHQYPQGYQLGGRGERLGDPNMRH